MTAIFTDAETANVATPAVLPLIFLDVDGVLNSHDINTYGYNTIHRDKVERLNRIVKATGAEVVISSAWRYMILGGSLRVDGFRYLLMTHGLASFVKVIGHTKSDEEIVERGDQIADYLLTHGKRQYVVLDDGSEIPQDAARSMTQSLYDRHGDRWLLIDGARGLTDADVTDAIAILRTELA